LQQHLEYTCIRPCRQQPRFHDYWPICWRWSLLSWWHMSSDPTVVTVSHNVGCEANRSGASSAADVADEITVAWRHGYSPGLGIVIFPSLLLLLLLQVVTISGQLRREYCKFQELKQRLAGGASMLWDRHYGVLLLLCRNRRWHCKPSRELKSYLFHMWCVGKQNPSTVVVFPWFQHHV